VGVSEERCNVCANEAAPVHVMKENEGRRSMAPLILNLGTS
jgi:hypothetical protein